MIDRTVLFGVTILLIKLCKAEYDINKYCQLVPAQTMLPSSTSAQVFFTCLGNGGSVKSNCADTDVFDKDSQSCVPASADNPSYFDSLNPCKGKNNAFVYNSRGCNWYSYCVDGQIVRNDTCDIGEIFNPASGSCINGACDDNSKANFAEICNIMPNGMYFGDFVHCHDWYKCSANGQEHGVCQGSLVFDTVTGKCLPRSGNMCQRISNVMQSEASGPPPDDCTSEGQIVGDTNVCSIYYVCRRRSPGHPLEWVALNCNHQYYDVISQQCRDPTTARVYPGCDRCQFTFSHASTYWANAVDPNCQQYLTCRQGRSISENLGSCEEDHFFDETVQACAEGEQQFDQYEAFHGPCQRYQCDASRMCSTQA